MCTKKCLDVSCPLFSSNSASWLQPIAGTEVPINCVIHRFCYTSHNSLGYKKKPQRKMESKIFCLLLSELPWSHLMWGLARSTVHHILKFVMDWMYVSPSESHVEALTSLSPKYGGVWSKEVIKFKCNHKESSLDPIELVSFKKRH